jgi:hypothetical protein
MDSMVRAPLHRLDDAAPGVANKLRNCIGRGLAEDEEACRDLRMQVEDAVGLLRHNLGRSARFDRLRASTPQASSRG